jgi:hypothetical protein
VRTSNACSMGLRAIDQSKRATKTAKPTNIAAGAIRTMGGGLRMHEGLQATCPVSSREHRLLLHVPHCTNR